MFRKFHLFAAFLVMMMAVQPAAPQSPNRFGADGAKPGTQAAKDYEAGFGYYRAQNYAPALPLFETACEGGDARGCYQLGAIFHNASAGEAQDMSKALPLYLKACDAGHAQACQVLGYIYTLNASWTTVTRDDAQAAILFDRACSGGNIEGCQKLGLAYELGQGVPKGGEKMMKAYGAACQGGSAVACRDLAAAFRFGRGVPVDKAMAAEFYGQAVKLDPRDLAGAAKALEDMRSGR